MKFCNKATPEQTLPIDTIIRKLPTTFAYLSRRPSALLKRLAHHCASNRLEMLQPCNCVLGFEGDYHRQPKQLREMALFAESELFNYPASIPMQADAQSDPYRANAIIRMIDHILTQRGDQ